MNWGRMLMFFFHAVLKKVPFLLSEQGWGEFDMEIVLHGVDKGGDHVVRHDLNFQKNKYESIHTIVSRLCFPYVLIFLAQILTSSAVL